MRSCLIVFAVAVPLFAQSRVTQIPPADSSTSQTASSKPAAAPSSFKVRCATCANEIEGKLSVTSSGVMFCCTGQKMEGQLVTAKCPFSFHLDLADVKEQFLDSNGDHAWHVVNGQKEHFAFTSDDGEKIDAAYAFVAAQSKKIVSSPLLDKYADELASMTHAPKIAPSTSCK